MTDADFYLNFVLFAVGGKMSEADAMMRTFAGSIQRAADQLCAERPFEVKPIYRGMLLDPALTFKPDPRLTFQSWTEDRGVAEWFASTDALISEPLAEANPRLRGFVAELPRPRARVLFHHSWAKLIDLPALAAMHPQLGVNIARQIEWAVATQHEVITEPVAGLVPLSCNIGGDRLVELERRLAPPWLQSEVVS